MSTLYIDIFINYHNNCAWLVDWLFINMRVLSYNLKTIFRQNHVCYVITFVGRISEKEQALDNSPPIPKFHYTKVYKIDTLSLL